MTGRTSVARTWARASALLVAAALTGGCSAHNGVEGDPFQRTDSSLPDLAPAERADARADAGPVDGRPPTDGSDDAPAGSVVVTVSVDQPADDAIVPTAQRFVPTVSVLVTAPAGATNANLDTVAAEVWSTGAAPKKLSSTPLALTTGGGLTDGGAARYVLAETPVDVSGLASGRYELRVTATTLGGGSGSASRTFRADSGPTITVTKPVNGSSYKGSLAAQVSISDALFAPVTGVTMSIGTHDLTVSGPGGTSGTDWSALIDFNAYMPPLDGDQLFKVTATNSNGTKTTVTVPLVIDNQGPAITMTTPEVGTIIGSLITISATVTDPTHVLDASVVAVVAHGSESFTVKLDPDPTADGQYKHQFDTRLLDNHDLYPTISFRASDLLGNESSIGYTVALDNTPPVADLDPPSSLRVRVKSGGTWMCSWPFDPLGSDAVNDGERVPQLYDVRARVEDLGNTPYSGVPDVIPISTLDPGRVELLVLDDTSQPLVVDSDGDGVCDKINPLLVPTTTPMSSKDALLMNLVPIPPTGNANMTADPSIAGDPSLDCVAGAEAAAPDPLCYTTDMTIAVPYAFTKEPAIWSPAPVISGTPQCVGNQFDAFANNIHDGWACLAVRAADKLGNEQVSRVLRICIDHDGVGNECPHQAITAIANATPMAVTTAAPHGLATGDEIVISRSDLASASGHWRVTVTGASTFTLDGSVADGQRPFDGRRGSFVKASVLPDCTGTQTAIQPPTVTGATPCAPWGAYPAKEVRTLL
jgi:hypothetical protein